MDDVESKWENKVLIICNNCRQNIRIPISYKPLQVTCPKCKNSFLYNYISEFGNEGEHYTKVQIEPILLILGLISIYFLGFLIFMVGQFTNHFQNWGILPFPCSLIIFIAAGIFIIAKLIDYKTFYKYLPIKLLVINQQGIIYFDNNFRAEECLNWSDIKYARYIYGRHMFGGLIETKREPACIELEVSGKGIVKIPPAMFFTHEQRMRIIAEILRHPAFIIPSYRSQ